MGQRTQSPQNHHSDHRRDGIRRCLRLLEILSDGRLYRRQWLQEELGVCKRTVLRDIATLRACGYWIETDQLEGNGYGNATLAYQMVTTSAAKRLKALRMAS